MKNLNTFQIILPFSLVFRDDIPLSFRASPCHLEPVERSYEISPCASLSRDDITNPRHAAGIYLFCHSERLRVLALQATRGRAGALAGMRSRGISISLLHNLLAIDDIDTFWQTIERCHLMPHLATTQVIDIEWLYRLNLIHHIDTAFIRT